MTMVMMMMMKMTMTIVTLVMTMMMRMRIVFQGTPPGWPTSFQPGRSPIVQLFTISIQRDVLFLKRLFFQKVLLGCYTTCRFILHISSMMMIKMDVFQEGTLHHFHSDGNRRGGLEKLDLFKKCSQAAAHCAAFPCHIYLFTSWCLVHLPRGRKRI